jgi:hypothetical protein
MNWARGSERIERVSPAWILLHILALASLILLNGKPQFAPIVGLLTGICQVFIKPNPKLVTDQNLNEREVAYVRLGLVAITVSSFLALIIVSTASIYFSRRYSSMAVVLLAGIMSARAANTFIRGIASLYRARGIVASQQ